MKLHEMLLSLVVVACFATCDEEKPTEAIWEYKGAVPEITDGPAQSQKMCYQLYKKYDLFVYTNLSGKIAEKTNVWYVQTTSIVQNNSAAIPMQAAEEEPAVKCLTLLTKFYNLLPDDFVSRALLKRQVLVKINPGKTSWKDDQGHPYFMNSFTEDQQGVLYFGCQDTEDQAIDFYTANMQGCKWCISYEFFRSMTIQHLKKVELPASFGKVSGEYYNDEYNGDKPCVNVNGKIFYVEMGNKYGFLHPFGVIGNSKTSFSADWGTYVAWILNTPKADREQVLSNYSKIKMKYDIVVDYYMNEQGINLEELSTKWLAVTY